MFSNQGIRTESWIIYGYPTETEADFDETLQWFIKNPNVLSHVTANAFGPNAKYMHDRPGIVTNDTGMQWGWTGLESTIEKRKRRFLLLIEVLESIRVAREGAFTFHVGDPFYVKYFSSWTPKDKKFLLKSWEMLENPNLYMSRQNGFKKVLNFFGVGNPESDKVAEKLSKKEDLEIGEINEMRERFFMRISSYLAQIDTLSEAERESKLEQYRKYFEDVKLHLNDNVSEDILFAMALKGSIQVLLNDIDTHAPEYIAQLAVETSSRFIIKARLSV
jgi:hypothetical protein